MAYLLPWLYDTVSWGIVQLETHFYHMQVGPLALYQELTLMDFLEERNVLSPASLKSKGSIC